MLEDTILAKGSTVFTGACHWTLSWARWSSLHPHTIHL